MTLRRTPAHLLLATAAMASLVLGGCASSSSKSRATPTPLAQFTPTIQIKTVWSQSVPTAEGMVGQGTFSPGASSGLAVASGTKGEVMAFALDSGKKVWQTQLRAPLEAGVATGTQAGDGRYAAINRDGELYLMNESGRIVWRTSLQGVAFEAPAVVDKRVVVRLGDNRLVGYDLVGGQRQWTVQRSLPPLTLRGETALVASSDNQLVYAGMPGGRLLAVEPMSGRVRFDVSVALPRGGNEVERIVDVLGAPAERNGRVCVSAYQAAVSCFDAQSGRTLWTQSVPAATEVVIDDRRAVVVDTEGRVRAYRLQDGEPAWQNEQLLRRDVRGLILYEGHLWAVDAGGVVHVLNAETGAMAARTNLDSRISGAPRRIPEGLLIQTVRGQLVLLRI